MMMHNYSKLKDSLRNNNTINDRKADIINLQVSSDKSDEIAKQHCIETMLNCFYRETRASGKYIRVLSSKELEEIYTKLPRSLMNHNGFFMLINLAAIGAEIMIAVKNDSKIGFCYYQSKPYLKLNDTTWETLAWDELATLLLKELANCYQQPFNNDLFGQIKNSVQVMSSSIKCSLQSGKKDNKELSFIESEQSLLFGHAFHPSPKSREGLTQQEIYKFSPELKAKFSLYYFLVRKDYIIQHSLLEKSAIELVQENSPDYLQKKDNYVLICTHPWQADYLKQLPIVKKALKQEYIYDLGQKGDEYYPTSSIRTVYHPNNPFFYKFSLNIRITNCVRKNAIYELKTAVCLTKILLTKLEEIKQKFPGFHLMLEPAYLSIDLPEGSDDEKKQVTEGFGMIFRQNFCPLQLENATPILAGSLFGKSLLGNSNIFINIKELCNKLKISYEIAAAIWFNQYAEKIIYPLLDCHFNLGITFEPHLQNVLIGMKDHMPLCVFVRDLEGTKLNPENWTAEYFTDLEENARQSIYYSEQLAWNRITYCLLVNNIGEAIFHIANGCAKLEMKLWSIVRQQLLSFQDKYGNEHSKKRIYGLLSNDPLPIKCNFLTRFLKKADKGAVYDYLIDHPLQEKNSHREINACVTQKKQLN